MNATTIVATLGALLGGILTGILTMRRDSSDAALRLIAALEERSKSQEIRIQALELLATERLDKIGALMDEVAAVKRERDDASARLDHAYEEIAELRAQIDELSRRDQGV